MKTLEKFLDGAEIESAATKIGTWKFASHKDLTSCIYEEIVQLTKYIFTKKANEMIEIEDAVSGTIASIPIFKTVLNSLKSKSTLVEETEEEVLDVVRIATSDVGDVPLARRALDKVHNTTKKKQTKTIMAAFMGSKVGKHLTREYGDRIESMTRDTVHSDGFINALNSVKDFDPTRPRSDPTMT